MSDNPKPRILVVDDDRRTVEDFIGMLGDEYECTPAHTAGDTLALIGHGDFDLMLLDHDLGHGLTGLEILKYVIDRKLNTPVIMISKHVDFKTVRSAWEAGAASFLGKSPTRTELHSAVIKGLANAKFERTKEALHKDVEKLLSAGEKWLITGISPAVTAVNKEILNVAPSDLRIMIVGESGTGKERVARSIHANSHRKDGPFVGINCAAIPASLAESEIFGHVKGAFSGASAHRRGYIEQAHGGTLFLDEIGTMSIEIQAKLLRFLEEREFCRIGGESPIKSDVRVVCATNANVTESIRTGQFRHDLYQRVKGAVLQMPPLRERPEDIPLLVDDILCRLRKDMNKPALSVANPVIKALQRHDWPGNVRELHNVLEYGAVHSPNSHIEVQHLPELSAAAQTAVTYIDARKDVLRKFQEKYWYSMYSLCKGNKSEMARVSDVSRQSVDKIVKSLGLESQEGE